jgi:uroporphyrin-III C-methyltransferase
VVVGEVVSLRSQLRSLVRSQPVVSEREWFLKAEAGHE